MEQENQKLRAFENAIQQETEEKISSIEQEIEEYKKNQMETAKEEEYNQMFTYMQEQVHRIKGRYKQAVTKYELDTKRSLLQLRSHLADQVFEEAAQKLLAFSNSSRYLPYLIQKIKTASQEFSCETYELKVRPEDLSYESELKKALPFSFTLCEDPKNHLGGFTLIDRTHGILADYTFASLLKEEHPKFYETCGMKIEF